MTKNKFYIDTLSKATMAFFLSTSVVLATMKSETTTSFFPVPFVANQGQWKDKSFSYLAILSDSVQVAVDKQGWRVGLLEEKTTQPLLRKQKNEATLLQDQGVLLRYQISSHNRPLTLFAGTQLPGVHNYFLGDDPQRWKSAVPLYESIGYKTDDGIDIRLVSARRAMTYIIDARPGAAIEALSFKIDGAESLTINSAGELVIKTAVGELRQTAPTNYQYIKHAPNAFGLRANQPPASSVASVITSNRLFFSTLFGGGDIDEIHAMATPPPNKKNIVTVCGITAEALYGFQAFPTTPGAFQTTHIPWTAASGLNNWPVTHQNGRAMDGFVTQMKIAPTSGMNGSNLPTVKPFSTSQAWKGELLFSTFLGSVANDYLESIHVLPSGLITVAGYIEHNPFNAPPPLNDYPLTANAVQTLFHYTPGNQGLKLAFREAMITQLNPQKNGANQLVYSTYFGGTYHEDVRAVVAEGPGEITFAGYTSSHDLPGINSYSFDQTLGATGYPILWYGMSLEYDAYLARISHAKMINQAVRQPLGINVLPTYLSYATYLGGSSGYEGTFEMINDLSIDGDVITVVGRTDALNFPVSQPTVQATIGSPSPLQWDAFVTQFKIVPLSLNPLQMIFSTYLGGGDFDLAEKVAVDPITKWIYVVGNTSSGHLSHWDPASHQTTQAGTPFPTTSNAVDQFLDDSDTVGYTPGCTATNAPFLDGYVSIIDPNPTNPQLVASTFFGGADDELATGIAVNQLGQVVITGWTHSHDLMTTPNAYNPVGNPGNPVLFDICNYQPSQNAADIFVARFNADLSKLVYATYFGANQDDFARDLFLTDDGRAVISGHTYSNPTGNTAYPMYAGSTFPTTADAFSNNYTDSSQVWGLHVNDYSSNASYNLGEPLIASLETAPVGVKRYGKASSYCQPPITIDVTSVPNADNTQYIIAAVNAPASSNGGLWITKAGAASKKFINVTQLVATPFSTKQVVSDAYGVVRAPVNLSFYGSIGSKIWVQFFFQDPVCSGPNGPYVASDALEIELQ